MTPMPAKPSNIIAHVEGLGTPEASGSNPNVRVPNPLRHKDTNRAVGTILSKQRQRV
jgi:hypothetical protein